MMAKSGYPKRIEPPRYKEAAILFGIAGIVAFALAFAITWYFPTVGAIWLVVASAEFLFRLIFSRKSIWLGFFILILTYAAVFSAAALH
jgi:hypothetical protein